MQSRSRRNGTRPERCFAATAVGAAFLLCGFALTAGTAVAGVGDSPLPRFSDGTPARLVMLVPGVVKRVSIQTVFFCSATGDVPANVGVEVFDTDGRLLNEIAAGVGVVLGVRPGQTVTIATSTTKAFLESAVIPLATKLQGSARIVASAGGVHCNAVLVDDGAAPPATLAALGEGVHPLSGAGELGIALPRFSDGKVATYALEIPGLVKRGRMETNVFCTSLASTPIDIGLEAFGPDGGRRNDVSAGNGAILGVAPGATVTFGTTGTVAFLETTVVLLAGVAQGVARVVSTSPDVTCSAFALDSDTTPPAVMAGILVGPEPLAGALR